MSARTFRHKLMLITDRNLLRNLSLEEAVQAALKGGIRCIQLREKNLDKEALLDLAVSLKALLKQYDASLIINSHAEAVLEVNADGLHLTSSGPRTSEMRTLMAENRWIGRSTHTFEEAVRAEEEGIDYVLFGPVFPTPSKKAYGPAIGLSALNRVTEKLNIPVLAVGGINLNNIRDVFRSGAWGAAVIRSVLGAENITDAAKHLVQQASGESIC